MMMNNHVRDAKRFVEVGIHYGDTDIEKMYEFTTHNEALDWYNDVNNHLNVSLTKYTHFQVVSPNGEETLTVSYSILDSCVVNISIVETNTD